MKKILTVFFTLALLLSFAACIPTQENATAPTNESDPLALPPGADVFYGLIVADMGGDALLVTENKTQGQTGGLYTLGKQYLSKEQDATLLVPGTYFRLYYGGYIMESYPMQFGAPSVFTCEGRKTDFVTPLVDFVLEKVPADAQWLALDLTGVRELSTGEREAIEYLLMCRLFDRCSIVQYDETRLQAENLLTADGSPDNGAVLRLEAEEKDAALVGTWRLTDSEQVTEGELQLSLTASSD